ncbi:PIN domain-containing protein [Acinetobacter towneri]|uniref:PIN domain-containing protein n=1 Tax=Acinetobacter towneri TaxID=202956 RepID=UPI002B262CDB|nr:PIN domain-containing protein [Acinetobacter towneri]WPC33058.1 PIN domain-containing protein [Acinetobacter towneri]
MNTSLIQTKVWLPIYKVESAIHYQSIRKPTAFEALILKLAIQHKEKLGQINLEKICEIFKIEQNFIANALETLIDNDVIERVSGYLEDIKVIHIKVTDLGRDLFYKNQMPSNPKVEAITCHYDPLLLSLVKAKNNWTSHNKDENLTLSKDVFSANLGQIGQLVDYIVQQADEKTFVWKKPNVNISKIENEVERILWRDLPIEIGLDSNANIHLESKGKGEDIAKFKNWLKQAEPELLWDQIISHVFAKLENDLPKLDWQQVLDVSLPDKELKLSSAKLSVYLDESPNKIVQGYEIILSQHCSTPKLNGKTLTVPMLFKPAIGFQALYLDQNLESSVVFQGNTEIYYAKQPRKVALKVRLKDLGIWEKIKTRVLQLIDIERLEPLVFARSFLSESQLIDHAPLLTAKQAYSLHDEMIKTHKVGLQNILWKEKIQTLETIEDLNYFRKIFPNISLKQTWLSSALLIQILDSAFEKSISSKTEFDFVYEPFIKANKELKSRIHPELLKQVIAHQKMDISKIAVKDIAAIDYWLEAYEQINQQLPDLIRGCKKIDQQFIGLNLLRQQVEQHFAPKRDDNKTVAILDSCYLMDFSERVKEIIKDNFVIIPQIVITELEGNKLSKDPEKAYKAREAIRAIKDLSNEHIEPSRLELSHFINKSQNNIGLSNDEQILSVALYHRLNSAKLYSRDNSLCNLAKSVNVKTQNN